MNIKYKPLKAFLLAVEAKSFTLAASRLAVTQPSFTSLIHDLEATVGLRLFERTTRVIALTAAGREFLEKVERPIADLEEAFRSMKDVSEIKRGTVVLGALPSTSLTLIPQALGDLHRAYPGLQVRVAEEHNDALLAMLRSNQIEFALATVLDATIDLDFEPLISDAFCAVFVPGHPVERLAKLAWLDLVPHDLVLLSRGSSARSQFERAMGDVDSTMSGLRCDVTNMTTAVNLVRQGMGVALLPRLALPALNLDKLGVRPIDSVSAHRTIGIVWRKDRHLSPGAEVLRAFLRQVAEAAEHSFEHVLPTRAAGRRSTRTGSA